MKKILIILLFCPILLFAQNSKVLSYRLAKMNKDVVTNKKTQNANTQVHLLLKGKTKAIKLFIEANNGTIKYQYNNIFAVRIPLQAIGKLSILPGLEKAEIHNRALYFDDIKALEFTSVDTVHAGGGLLLNSYTGKGVIFGMIDSGIDPTHPDFKNDDGTTRILSFWNQLDTLSSLAPYGYGKEYTKADIDAGLMSTYLDTTFDGHGTAVAGMAVGGGRAHENVKGMAPEADIVVVGINPFVLDYLDRTPFMLAIVDGVDYIFKKADAEGKPAVINISLGGLEGSHDGKDLPTRLIESMLDAKSGRALVTSAGNSANTKHHIGFEVQNDTLFSWFESMYANSEVCKRDSGAYMSFYGDSVDVLNLRYNISAEDKSPCCSILDEIGFRPFLQPLGQFQTDTLKSGVNILGIVTTFVEKIEDTYGFFMEIESDYMDMLWRFSLTGVGKIDGWAGPLTARSCNSTYIENPLTVGSAAQIQGFNNYVMPDNDQTIGNAYACSDKVITVGAYYVNTSMLDIDSINRTYLVSPKARASFSSKGPTRDGRIKPDISGPGSRVITTQASQILADKALNARSTLYLGGMHSITDGTSFASPAVAGIIALYFEKFPTATYYNIQYALSATADQDFLTGSVMPNNNNGYGRINAYQMLLFQGSVGIENNTSFEGLVYPNPSSGQFFIELSKNQIKEDFVLKVYDIRGVIVQQNLQSDSRLEVNISNSGFYILQLTNSSGQSFTSKIIVE